MAQDEQARHAVLALEDGSVWHGTAFGAGVEADGEVVFNTGMTGYQEICTDASYRGQLVLLTHPQVGNYGVSESAEEAARPWLSALVIRELAHLPNHWESRERLEDYLDRWGVPGIQGLDTRAITRRLRDHGALRAILRQFGSAVPTEAQLDALREDVQRVVPLSEKNLVAEVSCHETTVDADERRPHVVLVDYGFKANIARSLRRRGARVTLKGWDAGFEEIVAAQPDGIVLSNGPGDPAELSDAVATTRRLFFTEIPIMGICLGHQIIGQAAGAVTRRLPFGHHGGNHPVKELATGRVAITSQNHEFQVQAGPALDESGFDVSHVSLNDGSVEGLAHRTRPIFSVQFHPEGCPGPQDSQPQFDRLFELIAARKGGEG